MKILLGYSYYRNPVDVRSRAESWLARLRTSGVAVDGFCLTLNPPGPRLNWRELDMCWQRGDKGLLALYEGLARRLEDYDVFVNWNGINLHPDFVRQLSTFNVYSCFDDPESSLDLSQPVAWAYDLAMVGNIAELDTYHRWGVRQVRFWPLGFMANDYDPTLTYERLVNSKRDVNLTLICDRTSPWRRERLDRFVEAFPEGAYYGRGWANGFLPESQRVPLLQRTKIGINIHNSTGPVNYRTYYLPANGVLQICDNKSHLGRIFELNKEVVGFDTIEEAIELGHYYLAHDEERRQIAAAGWERTIRDYNEVAVFQLLLKYTEQLRSSVSKQPRDVGAQLRHHRGRTIRQRIVFILTNPLRWVYLAIHSVLSAVKRGSE